MDGSTGDGIFTVDGVVAARTGDFSIPHVHEVASEPSQRGFDLLQNYVVTVGGSESRRNGAGEIVYN